MTVYDLGFLALSFAAAAILLLAAGLALAGRRRGARIVLGVVAGGAVIYAASWAALTYRNPQPPLGVGDPKCIGDWCIAVEDVDALPSEQTTRYDVTVCLFSRAARNRTGFAAHAKADETTDVYLVDEQGTQYKPLPRDTDIALNVALDPGQTVRIRRTFRLPAAAHNIGLLAGAGSFGSCPMIGECTTARNAGDHVVASGVYRKGSPFLTLVADLRKKASSKPPQWR